MNTSNSKISTIFIATHPDIVKRTNMSSLLLSGIIFLLGAGLFITAFSTGEMTSGLNVFLMVLGTAFIFMGLFRLMWKTNKMIYKPTQSATNEVSLYFDPKDVDPLISSLDNSDFNSISTIKNVPNGEVRLDALISDDSNFAAVQLFEFVPNDFAPITKILYYKGDTAKVVGQYLRNLRN